MNQVFFLLLLLARFERASPCGAPPRTRRKRPNRRLCFHPRSKVGGGDMIAGTVEQCARVGVRPSRASAGVEVGRLLLPLEWYSDDSVGS